MIVYVTDVGVFGVAIEQYKTGSVVKWYLDGIEFESFLLKEEYIEYRIGGMDD